jgi:uncharacterized membrane protein
MDRQAIQLFLHVGAVVVALGPVFALPFLQVFAEREGVGSTQFMLAFSARIYRILIMPGAVVVFIFGTALIAANDRGYREGVPAWLAGCAIWFIVALALSFHYQLAAARRAQHPSTNSRVTTNCRQTMHRSAGNSAPSKDSSRLPRRCHITVPVAGKGRRDSPLRSGGCA